MQCRNQWVFFQRSNLSVPLTQRAVRRWTPRKLIANAQNEQWQLGDEHVRQRLPGNNWLTLWWSATITCTFGRGRQSHLINIKTRGCVLARACVYIQVSSRDSGDAIWRAILHGWRQSSVQESEVRCRLVNKALIGRIDFTWHGSRKDVALSRAPSPPPLSNSRS